VTPIRPLPHPIQPAGNAAADVGRQAAQRAFFDAAMGRNASSPLATPAAPQASVAAPAHRVETRLEAPAQAPAKLLRPGSLLDIRV
jgi:hypothetical protein